MSKEMLNNFWEDTKDFFLNPERNPDGTRMSGVNKTNVTAILIAGFVGWLLITATFGAKLKKLWKKVPLLGNIFPKAKTRVRTVYRNTRGRMTRKK